MIQSLCPITSAMRVFSSAISGTRRAIPSSEHRDRASPTGELVSEDSASQGCGIDSIPACGDPAGWYDDDGDIEILAPKLATLV